MRPDHEPFADPGADPMPQLRVALRALTGSRVRDAALADDLAQETLLRVETRLGTLRSRDRLQAWVFQMARNSITDHFRKARETETFDEAAHERDLAEPDPTPPPEEEGLNRELLTYVRSVVNRLPALYRDAIRMTELEGVSQVELARRLGLSVSAAKSRVQRGRAMLREEMERCWRWETDRYGKVLAFESRGECDCQEGNSAIPHALKADLAACTGCVAGAASPPELKALRTAAGFTDIRVEVKEASRAFINDWLPAKQAGDYVASANITARKPNG